MIWFLFLKVNFLFTNITSLCYLYSYKYVLYYYTIISIIFPSDQVILLKFKTDVMMTTIFDLIDINTPHNTNSINLHSTICMIFHMIIILITSKTKMTTLYTNMMISYVYTLRNPIKKTHLSSQFHLSSQIMKICIEDELYIVN